MAITRVKTSSILQNFPKERSMLAGNDSDTGAYESITTITASTNVATITFSNIPQTYQHLQFRFYQKNTSTDLWLYANVNGDSSTLYTFQTLHGNGSTTSAQALTGDTYGRIMLSVSQQFGGAVLDVLDYKSTNKTKTFRCLWGTDINGAGGYVGINSILYNNASTAITSVTFDLEGTGNFSTGTSISLYGIR